MEFTPPGLRLWVQLPMVEFFIIFSNSQIHRDTSLNLKKYHFHCVQNSQKPLCRLFLVSKRLKIGQDRPSSSIFVEIALQNFLLYKKWPQKCFWHIGSEGKLKHGGLGSDLILSVEWALFCLKQ